MTDELIAPTDPTTAAGWHEAVDLATGALALDAARQYGLVTGGPAVNVDRCNEILARGLAAGVTASKDAVAIFVAGMAP